MNKFSKFIFKTAAVDVDIINTCPDKDKFIYFCAGMFVLITTIFAFLSGGYALYIAFKNLVIALAGGGLWACFVYTFDRFLMASLSKDKNTKWKQFGIRITIALVISTIISKPLELLLVSSQIQKVLNEKNNAQITGLETANEEKINKNNKEIEACNAEIAEKENNPPANFKRARADWERAENRYDNQTKSLTADIQLLANQRSQQEKRLSNSPQYIINDAKIAIKAIDKKIRNYSDKIKIEEKAFESAKTLFAAEGGLYGQEVLDLKTRCKQKTAEIDSLNKVAQGNSNSVINKTKKLNEENGLLEQIAALAEAQENDPSLAGAGWFIMILFIIIEIAPIGAKMLISKTIYEQKIAHYEEEEKLKLEELLNQISANINTDKEIRDFGLKKIVEDFEADKKLKIEALDLEFQQVLGLKKNQLEAELNAHISKYKEAANADIQEVKRKYDIKQAEIDQQLHTKKEVLKQISDAHLTLIKEQVAKWLETERQKIKNSQGK